MKLRCNKIFLISIALFFSFEKSIAQDLHFSQYFNAPLLVNPANTGFEPDVDWRIGLNYRNQWSNILSNPYKTFSAWGDAQILTNRFDNGWVGIGGALLKDEAGSGNLSTTRAFGSVAYHQLLGNASLLSLGFNIGYVNKRIDFSKLTFDNQWNGKFFDITVPSGEVFTRNSVGYFDLQAGMNYAYFASEKAYFNIGFSASHINQPSESFFSGTTADTKLDVRYTTFINGSFKIDDQWILNPNMYISKMGNAYETVTGMNASYNLSGDGSLQVSAGLYDRLGDALIPMIGFQLKDFKLTFSYDKTTSSLATNSQTVGAYEFSIVKSGLFSSGGKPLKCPMVRF